MPFALSISDPTFAQSYWSQQNRHEIVNAKSLRDTIDKEDVKKVDPPEQLLLTSTPLKGQAASSILVIKSKTSANSHHAIGKAAV